MKAKETRNVETDKIIKYKISVQYHKKCLLFIKSFSSTIKQYIIFLLWMIAFVTLWINTPRPNWEIHNDWENDI